MLNEDSFSTKRYFTVSDRDKIIVVAGTTGSGKTRLLETFKNFYENIGYINIDHDFDSHNITTQREILYSAHSRPPHQIKVNLYFDEYSFLKPEDRNRALREVRRYADEPYINKIFITAHVSRFLNFERNEFGNVENKLMLIADMVLVIDNSNNEHNIEIIKHRTGTAGRVLFQNLVLEENFIKLYAESYGKYFNDNAKLKKYFKLDYSKCRISSFKELFSYYK